VEAAYEQMNQQSLAFASLLLVAGMWAQPYLHPPSVETYATHDPAAVTVLPNGRHLQPAGSHFPLVRFPYGLAMSRDGSRLFVPSDGVGQILTQWQSGSPKIVELKLPKPEGKKFHLNAGGADFSPDGKLLYWSSGERGTIFVFDTGSAQMLAEISLNVEVARVKFEDSYAADVKVSADGEHLYCADVTNFRLAIIDTGQRSPGTGCMWPTSACSSTALCRPQPIRSPIRAG
jgi:DNA-binding beta-propeller fold protein YncE